MTQTTSLLIVLAVAAAGCGDPPEPQTPPAIDTTTASAVDLPLPDTTADDTIRPAPDFTLPTLAGETFALSEHHGKVLLVNFWATWCAPCRAEIPDLIELHEDLHDEGFAVVGISLDEGSADEIRPFAESFEINYPVLIGNYDVVNAFGDVYGLPTSFLIDREGRIVRRIIGIVPVDEIRSTLEQMLRAS